MNARLVEQQPRYTVVCDLCGELAVDLRQDQADQLASDHEMVEHPTGAKRYFAEQMMDPEYRLEVLRRRLEVLHYADPNLDGRCCREDGLEWPCRTAQALESVATDEPEPAAQSDEERA